MVLRTFLLFGALLWAIAVTRSPCSTPGCTDWATKPNHLCDDCLDYVVTWQFAMSKFDDLF